ncbi:MAG: hypothetical protein WCY36_03210 [Candidatus Omnitrophota bacterium]
MKNKGLLIGMVAVLAIIVLAFVMRPVMVVKGAKKAAPVSKAEKLKADTKKTFLRGMGGLTVKMQNSMNKPQTLRIKAFRSEGNNSSIFVGAFTADRMQELLPGTYDIEVETVPMKIYKNINVNEGKETVYDLGAVTGAVNIKALNSKKKEAFFSALVREPKSNSIVASITTNRPAEIIPGVYNIDIQTLPRQTRDNVKIEGGKQTVIDLGVVSGGITVKTLDADGKEVRTVAKLQDVKTKAITASIVSNNPNEAAPGEYEVEVIATPAQPKKSVKIIAGEEAVVEFIIPNQPAPKAAVAVRKK